jgi:SAM-dependent methyltransferase
MSSFKISEQSFEYLVAQVGELDGLKSVPAVWERAYERNTMDRINNILPHIPEKVGSILDIGSGLGGIDILLYRWFDQKPTITLLDGSSYSAMVNKHAEPFNSARVALDFQRENGVKSEHIRFMEHDMLRPGKYDLILSFRAWCFHIAPAAYLRYVEESVHPGSVIIVDVRKDAEAQYWREQLQNAFHLTDVIEEGRKHQRWKLKPIEK